MPILPALPHVDHLHGRRSSHKSMPEDTGGVKVSKSGVSSINVRPLNNTRGRRRARGSELCCSWASGGLGPIYVYLAYQKLRERDGKGT